MIRHRTAVRILRALHATLGRWLASAGQSAAKRRGVSWFGCDPGTVAPTRSTEDAEAAAWHRAHFHNWPVQR